MLSDFEIQTVSNKEVEEFNILALCSSEHLPTTIICHLEPPLVNFLSAA